MKFKADWFLIGMMLAVFLAWAFPAPGAAGGSLHPELLVKAGIALIFFLHGLLLSFASLKDGIFRWRLHLIVQLGTFLLFPLYGFIYLSIAGGFMPPDLKLGFFYLCALPSTVSSSIAMTAAARGNVPVAVFNATISSIIGIFITPFWMGLITSSSGVHIPYSAVVIELCTWLILPLIAGQALRPLLGKFAERHKKFVNKVDRLTILLLIYTSFCDSFANHIWSAEGPKIIIIAAVSALVLFTCVLLSLIFFCNKIKLAPEFRAAVVFCGTKKGLSTAIPMAKLMFASHPSVSLIVLPIMIYHPLQLLICGPLSSHWAKQLYKSPLPKGGVGVG